MVNGFASTDELSRKDVSEQEGEENFYPELCLKGLCDVQVLLSSYPFELISMHRALKF